MNIVDLAQVIGGFAAGIAAGVAIPTVGQFWANARLARETVAVTTYSDYLHVAFENPEYSSGRLAAPTIGLVPKDKLLWWQECTPEERRKIWENIEDHCTDQTEKYLWYLSIVLSSCEKIIQHVPKSNAWTETVKAQLRYHWYALEDVWEDNWRKHYDDGDGTPCRFVEIVDEVLNEGPPE